jgi:uncharacterized protein with von Willebrand factor type A (vWA) domain
MQGLAPGLAAAPVGRDTQDTRRLQLAERLRMDERLRAVLRKAGRLTRLASKARYTRTDGHSEVVSVERGGDLSRLLPGTLALLDDPDLGDWALAQVIDRKAQQYSLAGKAPVGRGPIVVLRDVSGSMHGEPNDWAAAVCIMAAHVAAKEHRQLTVINYNGDVDTCYRLDTSGRTHTNEGRHPRWQATGGRVEDLVLDVATVSPYGGTRLEGPVNFALDHGGLIEERADLIIITDGYADSVSKATADRVAQAKEQGLRISGLTINGGTITPVLRQLCDSTQDLDRSGDTAKQAAGAVLL